MACTASLVLSVFLVAGCGGLLDGEDIVSATHIGSWVNQIPSGPYYYRNTYHFGENVSQRRFILGVAYNKWPQHFCPIFNQRAVHNRRRFL